MYLEPFIMLEEYRTIYYVCPPYSKHPLKENPK